MRQARRGLGHIYQRGNVWWVAYHHKKRKIRESSRSANRSDAVRLLRRRLGEIGTGRFVGIIGERSTFEDLKKLLLDDYAVSDRRSVERAKISLAHLGESFEHERAIDITGARLLSYVKIRKEAGVAPATIRYELAVLRRAYNLGHRAGIVAQVPPFPAIAVHNARRQFIEDGDFEAILEHLPPAVKPLAEFLYWTGWRKSEALSLAWHNVDFNAGVVRIEDSKSREPRTFPFRALPALEALLRRQRERVEDIQAARRRLITRVFTWDDGRPIVDFRGAWEASFKTAGLPLRLVHDLRRGAARRLSRAGVPEQVIMQLCGWRTRSVFDRYRIVNETDLSEGLAKLARASENTPGPAAPKVVTMRRTGTVRAQ